MKKPDRVFHAGFSLVEIALALAVMAFGLLTTVALLPEGLQTLGASATDTAQARIVQEVNARLLGSDWDKTNSLGDFDGRDFYFDKQGNEMATASADTIFTVQLSVPAKGVTLPSDNLAEQNAFLREVQIKITKLPTDVPDRFTDLKKHRNISLLVARTSR